MLSIVVSYLHEWLRGIQSLRPKVIEISRTPVNLSDVNRYIKSKACAYIHLHKNTWEGNREFGIIACTGIGARR